ncbi:MAG TPA: type VI secretion system tube protein Hcp [Candidatus Aquilonibacter sp.]|nr:type VI secretion system tube protein Hcp [Candidatus Aquilonibacter sp.]
MFIRQKLFGVRLGRFVTGSTILVLATAASLVFSPRVLAADAGYIRIVGPQGQIEGTAKEAAHLNWVTISSVVAEDLNGDAVADRESSAPAVSELTASAAASKASAPRDAATGISSGRRMHQPLVITKEIDKASPMLAKACASGQHLPEVDVDLASGEHYKLTDVVISSDTKKGEAETISFSYQKIEITK